MVPANLATEPVLLQVNSWTGLDRTGETGQDRTGLEAMSPGRCGKKNVSKAMPMPRPRSAVPGRLRFDGNGECTKVYRKYARLLRSEEWSSVRTLTEEAKAISLTGPGSAQYIRRDRMVIMVWALEKPLSHPNLIGYGVLPTCYPMRCGQRKPEPVV